MAKCWCLPSLVSPSRVPPPRPPISKPKPTPSLVSRQASLLQNSKSHVAQPNSLSLQSVDLPPLRFGRLERWRARLSRGGVCKMGRSDLTSELELERPEGKRKPEKRVNAVFWIILLNLGIYVADHFLKFPGIRALYLYHGRPDWYQFVTSTFCHASWEHLSSNLFLLYIFGKLVEEEEGSLGLWISYIITGAGANLVSWLLLPRSAVSVGASGAVFGLFAISVLVKMSWDWRKILEVFILGQFVIEKVMEAAQASTNLMGSLGRNNSMGYINHIAHLSGALIGASLIFLISRVPSQSPDTDVNTKYGKGNKRN